MRTPAQQLRAVLDGLRKRAASRPDFPTGGDNRTTEEALGTGAAARNLAMTSTKAPKLAKLNNKLFRK